MSCINQCQSILYKAVRCQLSGVRPQYLGTLYPVNTTMNENQTYLGLSPAQTNLHTTNPSQSASWLTQTSSEAELLVKLIRDIYLNDLLHILPENVKTNNIGSAPSNTGSFCQSPSTLCALGWTPGRPVSQ